MIDAPLHTLQPFLDSTELVVAFELDAHGSIVHANGAAAARLGRASSELHGIQIVELVAPADRAAVAAALSGDSRRAVVQFVTADGVFVPLAIHVFAAASGALVLGEPPLLPYLRLGDELSAYASELSVQARERGRLAKHLAAELEERKRTNWELRREQEVLPICMSCGRVHTTDMGWESLADFVRRSSEFLSHGYCDACARELLRG